MSLKNASTKLKNNKTSGNDEITNEMIKNGGHYLHMCLLEMFNRITETEKMPAEWTNVVIKSVYKNKGKKEELKNQRGLFLTQSLSKLYEKLILSRIDQTLERNMTEFQNGARSNRSAADNLFMLRAQIDYYKYYNIKTMMIFYDLEKAFDYG